MFGDRGYWVMNGDVVGRWGSFPANQQDSQQKNILIDMQLISIDDWPNFRLASLPIIGGADG